MEADRAGTGADVMDRLLEGGYETDVITTIYGPGGSGKTNLCLIAASEAARKGKKVIYIDTEGVSIERLKQIDSDYKKTLKNIIFIRPASLRELENVLDGLREEAGKNVGLIIIDTIAKPYRLEASQAEDISEVNKELGLHLTYLAEMARSRSIPVLMINQVYSDFEEREKVNIVGGDVVRSRSKCLIELQIDGSKRKAIVRKHRSIKEGKEAYFEIVGDGVREAKREFKLF